MPSILELRTFREVANTPLFPAEVIYSPPVEIGEWGAGKPEIYLSGTYLFLCPALEYLLADQIDEFCKMWQQAGPVVRVGMCEGMAFTIAALASHDRWSGESLQDLKTLSGIAAAQMEENL